MALEYDGRGEDRPLLLARGEPGLRNELMPMRTLYPPTEQTK